MTGAFMSQRRTPRHFLSQSDISPDEMQRLFDEAEQLRLRPRTDGLRGRTLVMLFEKPSTRTRLSFEIGMTQLGGHAVCLDHEAPGPSRRESLRDEAEVISRYADAMMARVSSHSTLEELARYSTIPVINGLSDLEHPMQSMSDLLTIRSHLGTLKGRRVAFVGDGNNNVTHSLLLACSLAGADIRVAAPPQLQPDPSFVLRARRNARNSGSAILITDSPVEAVSGADVIYTDTWVSMGKEAGRESRVSLFAEFQVNGDLVANASPNCIFMHCLPQHVGDEVTEEVAYGRHSVIFDQAENRLHMQKAIVLFLLGEEAFDGVITTAAAREQRTWLGSA
jgi:ornithine carbamoyltransferase